MPIALAIFALLVVLGMTTNAIPALQDIADRGKRLTHGTTDTYGVVVETADQLVREAAAVVGRAVNVDAYSLARMVRSEEGSAGQIAKVFLCHVMCNQAAALGWGITQTVQFHTAPYRAQAYGKQITGRVASGSDPYESDLAAAEYALAQRAQGEDPTNGATNFVDVGAFGAQAGTGSFNDLVDHWAEEGKVPGKLPNTPKGLVFFWRGQLPPGVEAIG